MLLTLFFVGILLISFLLIAWLSRPSPQEKTAQKRLTTLLLRRGERDSSAEAGEDLLKQKIAAGSIARLDDFLDRFDFYPKLETLIQQAHRSTTPGRVIMQSSGLGVAAALLTHFLYPVLGVEIAAPLAAAALPCLLLIFQRGRRLKQFNDALPDSIDLMSRALKAGHSVSSAIEVVAEQGHEPVASEFGEVFRAQNFGLPFRDALAQLAERVPSQDLHFLVTAMMVQKETGGNLTEILDRTTHVIRERLRIMGEVKTKTAQGRLTGAILAALPIILGVMINFLNPGYARPLFHDPLGKKMLYTGAGLITLGGFIISRIVKIEV